MIALVLAKQIATLFFIMLVGFIVVKAGLLKSADSRVVTIIYISLMAAMSASATTVTVQAQLCDRDPVYASQINIFTTLSCIITMPLMTLLYQL